MGWERVRTRARVRARVRARGRDRGRDRDRDRVRVRVRDRDRVRVRVRVRVGRCDGLACCELCRRFGARSLLAETGQAYLATIVRAGGARPQAELRLDWVRAA